MVSVSWSKRSLMSSLQVTPLTEHDSLFSFPCCGPCLYALIAPQASPMVDSEGIGGSALLALIVSRF